MGKAGTIICLVLLTLTATNCRKMDQGEIIRFQLNCRDLTANEKNSLQAGEYKVELIHREGEPAGSNRIMIMRGPLQIELLPSKGLSVGAFNLDGKAVLWEAPIGLPDPDELDFSSDEIHIFGEPAPGFEFIKTFVGGIELMGLRNWGMPRKDPSSGELLPLHGEVGNIPVDTLMFETGPGGLKASGTVSYRSFEGDTARVWYERGELLYRVTRTLELKPGVPGFRMSDSIQNISGERMQPDWGYHVTFRPEAGSKLLVASASVEERGGGTLPDNIETWQPAIDEKIRTEIGIIHKGVKAYDLQGVPSARVLKRYPDGRAFELNVPLSPYFQTWYSSGGCDNDEFHYADGTPVFTRSWNGFGIEIGSSPLDHNGNIDPAVSYQRELEPGASRVINFAIRTLDPAEADALEAEIRSYSASRR